MVSWFCRTTMISAVRILCKKSVTNEALSYNQGGQFYVITGGQFSVVTTTSFPPTVLTIINLQQDNLLKLLYDR